MRIVKSNLRIQDAKSKKTKQKRGRKKTKLSLRLEAMRKGTCVLVYPGGDQRLREFYRSKIDPAMVGQRMRNPNRKYKTRTLVDRNAIGIWRVQ